MEKKKILGLILLFHVTGALTAADLFCRCKAVARESGREIVDVCARTPSALASYLEPSAKNYCGQREWNFSIKDPQLCRKYVDIPVSGWILRYSDKDPHAYFYQWAKVKSDSKLLYTKECTVFGTDED